MLACNLSCLAVHSASTLSLTCPISPSRLEMVARVLVKSGLEESCGEAVACMCSSILEPSLARSSIWSTSRVFLRIRRCLCRLSSACSMELGAGFSVKGSTARARRLEMEMQSHRNGSTCCNQYSKYIASPNKETRSTSCHSAPPPQLCKHAET